MRSQIHVRSLSTTARTPQCCGRVPGAANMYRRQCQPAAMAVQLTSQLRTKLMRAHVQGAAGAAGDVAAQDDPYSSVSTKVTPVSPPEAASWSVVIVAAYALTAGLAYVVVSQLFMQTPEAAAFDAALSRVREDFRVTVRLGDRIKGARASAFARRSQHVLPTCRIV
jgi:TIM21